MRSEFKFWVKNLDDKNGHKVKMATHITRIVFSDASNTGFGGYILEKKGILVGQGHFSPYEQATSSTHKELKAVAYLLSSFQGVLQHDTIQWHTDNSNVSRIIEAGSTKPDLQKLAIKIYKLCLQNNNIIHPVWIPREENALADLLSRPNYTDDFSIDYKTYYIIQRRLGQCTIDRFADHRNKKHHRFNSKFYCPNTEAVNAFTCDWKNELNWLAPPISLIGKTIKHAAACHAKGILMIPLWESSYFYPMIWNGIRFKHFVKAHLLVNPYYYSQAENSVFQGHANFRSIALLLDFT